MIVSPNWFDRQWFLGSFANDENMADKKISEVLKIQKRPVPKALKEYAESGKSRDVAIQPTYRSGGYTLESIGEYYGLHYSTVSRIIHNGMQK